MSPAFEAAIDDLTLAVRTTIDLAVRAASWVLLTDDDNDDEATTST